MTLDLTLKKLAIGHINEKCDLNSGSNKQANEVIFSQKSN